MRRTAPMGWFAAEAAAWPLVVEHLPRPWPIEVVITDLRWWVDQIRGRHVAALPTVREAAERWGWTRSRAHELMRAPAQWVDPRQAEAAADAVLQAAARGPRRAPQTPDRDRQVTDRDGQAAPCNAANLATDGQETDRDGQETDTHARVSPRAVHTPPDHRDHGSAHTQPACVTDPEAPCPAQPPASQPTPTLTPAPTSAPSRRRASAGAAAPATSAASPQLELVTSSSPSSATSTPSEPTQADQVRAVYAAWRQHHPRARAEPPAANRKQIGLALGEWEAADLVRVIDWAHLAPDERAQYLRGETPQSRAIYLSVEGLTRPEKLPERVELARQWDADGRPPAPKQQSPGGTLSARATATARPVPLSPPRPVPLSPPISVIDLQRDEKMTSQGEQWSYHVHP